MISIIIPVYNSASKGLDACLQRVAAQTYEDLQVLLVDDGSTDDSGKICDEWALKDSRIEVIHQKNQGPAAARNVAMDHIKGEEVAFVDSDDLPEVNLIQVLHDALTSQQAEMAMSRFNEARDVPVKYSDGYLSRKDMLLGLFSYYTPLYKNLYAKLFKRALLDNIRFANLRTAEDVDFLSRVYARVEKCAFVNQSLYIYNRYEDSIMHSQTARDYLDILQCYEGIYERLGTADEFLTGRALDALMRKVVSLRYRNRNMKDASLSIRLDMLEKKFISVYRKCKNGNLFVKMGLLACLKLPWLHAMVMDYRER